MRVCRALQVTISGFDAEERLHLRYETMRRNIPSQCLERHLHLRHTCPGGNVAVVKCPTVMPGSAGVSWTVTRPFAELTLSVANVLGMTDEEDDSRAARCAVTRCACCPISSARRLQPVQPPNAPPPKVPARGRARRAIVHRRGARLLSLLAISLFKLAFGACE